jgi:hypothetical protein
MTLNTTVIPVEINCDYKDFVKAYRSAKITADPESIQFLINALTPQFLIWESLLLSKDLFSNITLATLFSLLAMDNKPKDSLENKYNNLLYYMDFYAISFTDLCIEAFLLHLKKQTIVYSNYTKPKKFFFFLNKEIKSFLFKIIRKILQLHRKDFSTNPSKISLPDYSLDMYFDHSYLDKVQDNNPLLYSSYLFFLVNQKLSDYTLKDKYKLSVNQSKQLNEDLCQLIKTLLSSS